MQVAIVVLKYSTKANTRACKSEVKLARFRSFRTKILNHNSIWFIHDSCFGV
jgi:hypothetical protein